MVDNVVLVEGLVLIALGSAYAIQNKKPETPVLAGSIGVLLLVGLLEVFGGGPAKIGKALLTLAVFTAVIAEGGALLSSVQNSLGVTPS